MRYFNESVIAWQGQEYTLKPDMRLLGKLEDADVSSEKISMKAISGDIPKVALARFLAIVMRYAGVDVSDERMLQEVEHKPKDALSLFTSFRDAIYTLPPDDLVAEAKKENAKKPEAGKVAAE